MRHIGCAAKVVWVDSQNGRENGAETILEEIMSEIPFQKKKDTKPWIEIIQRVFLWLKELGEKSVMKRYLENL